MSYKQVAWLDADVAINARHAPSVFANCPEHKLGGVGFRALPTPPHIVASSSQLLIAQIERSFSEWRIRDMILNYENRHRGVAEASEEVSAMYREKGLSFSVDESINTGVMVLSPEHHRGLMEYIYRTYEDIYAPISDQFAIPAEAYRAGIVHDLDSRFNVQVNGELASKYPFLLFTGREMIELLFLCLQTSFSTSFFLHFAAAQQRMEFFMPFVYDWGDFARLGPNFHPSISLKKNIFDPAAVSASYFGCVAELQRVHAIEPRLESRLFFRSFAEKVVVFYSDVLSVGSTTGIYDPEPLPLVHTSYRWVDGRGATISFPYEPTSTGSYFLKYEIEVCYYDDGTARSLEQMLSTSFFVNGYPFIDRVANSPPDKMSRTFFYSGYCWMRSGLNYVQIVAPNSTPYSLGINSDPRTLSIALFNVRLRLLDFPCK